MLPVYSHDEISSLDLGLTMITGHNLIIDGGFTIK